MQPGLGSFQTADGAELTYQIVGQGLPIIICHPFIANPADLPTPDTLGVPVALVLLDARGLGQSAAVREIGELTMERLVQDMEELRLHLGVDQWIVHGRAEGAFVAMQYALRYPGATAGLVLFSPAASYEYLLTMEGMFDRHHPAFIALQQSLWRLLADPIEENLLAVQDAQGELVRRARERAMGDEPPPAPRPWPGELRPHVVSGSGGPVQGTPLRLQRFMTEILSYDLRTSLPEITAPTLVLAGRFDPLCPVEQSEEVAKLIPGATMVVCERATHTLIIEERPTVLRALGGYLRQHGFLSGAAPTA